jgi:hypothetical protein
MLDGDFRVLFDIITKDQTVPNLIVVLRAIPEMFRKPPA